MKLCAPGSSRIEQGGRNKARIMIETFLIELNEEMFAISDELARVYGDQRTPKAEILKKAKEFERRKNLLLKRIAKGLEERSAKI